jgi:hypothetical protein
MDEIIKKNKASLSRYHPYLLEKLSSTRELAPYGFIAHPAPNILCDGKPYHSRVNPEKEAYQLVKGLTVKKDYIFIFIGIGLGYHIELFLRMYPDAEKTKVIAIEKSREAFSILVDRRDISFLKNTRLFIDEDPEIIESYFQRLDPLSFKGYRIIRLRGASHFFPDYYEQLENYFKNSLSGKLSDLLTRFAFETLWMKNIVQNIPSLSGKRSIRALKNCMWNKPALIIAAGPSLLYQLESIKDISQKLVVIAVDTAVGPLIKSGIFPDFIVTLDAQYYNLYDFFPIHTNQNSLEKTVLIADIVTNPRILKYWKNELFFSATAESPGGQHPIIANLCNFFSDIDFLDCGGSVATTAVECALYMGASPVFITGLDLSYAMYMTHINSSALYTHFYTHSSRFNTLQSSMLDFISKRKLQIIDGIGDLPVITDFVFITYLKWFMEKRTYYNKVFNVTKIGAAVPNLIHIDFDEMSRTYFKQNKEGLKIRKSDIFTRKKSLQFLLTLRDELLNARKEFRDSLKSESDILNFLEKYGSLRNIVLVAKSLYKNPISVHNHVNLVIPLIERQINRSIEKISSNQN